MKIIIFLKFYLISYEMFNLLHEGNQMLISHVRFLDVHKITDLQPCRHRLPLYQFCVILNKIRDQGGGGLGEPLKVEMYRCHCRTAIKRLFTVTLLWQCRNYW